MSKHMSCENCRFWDTSTQLADAQADTTGKCRILPPVVDMVHPGMGLWPFTEDTDWCAKFKAADGEGE